MKKSKTLSLAVVLIALGISSPATADMNPPLAALGPVPVHADNPQTPAKIALGKLLFGQTCTAILKANCPPVSDKTFIFIHHFGTATKHNKQR